MTAVPAASSPPASLAGGRSRDGIVTMVRYGLRTHRWALVGVAFLGFVSPYASGSTYLAAAGTAAARATSSGPGQDREAVGNSLRLSPPIFAAPIGQSILI